MPDETVRARLNRVYSEKLSEIIRGDAEIEEMAEATGVFLADELDKTNAAIERLRGEMHEAIGTDRKFPGDSPAESDAVPEGGGWIDWHGGACPVADDARVEARFRNGHVSNACAAGSLVWEPYYCYTADVDVIAYRVVLPAPSPEITPAMIEAGAYEHALEHMEDEPVTVRLADRLIAENIIRAALEAK
jgi:hypothetical protein